MRWFRLFAADVRVWRWMLSVDEDGCTRADYVAPWSLAVWNATLERVGRVVARIHRSTSCRWFRHDYEVEGYAGPETASEWAACRRCGDEWSVIYY